MDFSFVIPVYNCKPLLRACVDSILEIPLSSFEVILVDDGSEDGSSELCDALSREHIQIRVIHQENAGASAARNTGLQAAIGTHILFVDSDDTLDSEVLNKILSDPRCLESDLTIFGLTFDYYHHRKCYRRDSLLFEGDCILTPDVWQKIIYELFACNSISPLWNKVMNRELILNNKLALNTNMFLYEDLEFVLRYLACCGDIWNVPKAVYHYRQAEDEGNAGRRLSRIQSIPDFLTPIENAMDNLRTTHPGIAEEDCARILQTLHLTLAREKIGVSSLKVIRQICNEYSSWENSRILTPTPSKFRDQLIEKRIFSLWLSDKLTAIRHRIAVAVKSALFHIREESKRNA